MITIPTSDIQGMTFERYDAHAALRHAAQRARDRHFEKLFIVDVDSHHFEGGSVETMLEYMDDPYYKQVAKATAGLRGGVYPTAVGYQDMSGRLPYATTYRTQELPEGVEREAASTLRWMDAMGIDITVLFPNSGLQLSFHPLIEFQSAMARAYNRWLIECVLSVQSRIKSLLYLPLHDPEASYKMVTDFGDKPGVVGFSVIATHDVPVHANSLMKTYDAIQERGLVLAFHAHQNWRDGMFRQMNRFISTHAIGFPFFLMCHMTNWIVNGLPERFPKLKTLWIEGGVAWIPFLMMRLDHEYALRSNECPLLKKKPSEYMREFYYSSQPMEVPDDLGNLEHVFKVINAETQLLYASDYPHWDFDLPSTIYDLPFLSDQAKRNILGESAATLFCIERPPEKLARIPEA